MTPEAKDPAAYIANEIPVHVIEYIEKRFAELGESVRACSLYRRVLIAILSELLLYSVFCILPAVANYSS